MKDSKKIKLLIKSHKEASIRSRKAFIILNITTIILLVVVFNYKFSWLNEFSDYYNYSNDKTELNKLQISEESGIINILTTIEENKNNKNDSLINNISLGIEKINNNLKYSRRRSVLKNSLGDDFEFIDIGIIGTKLYIQDIPILGGVALALILTWFFYTIRRENEIIKYIFYNFSNTNNFSNKEYAFYGVSFNSTFTKISSFSSIYFLKIPVSIMKLVIIFLIILPTLTISLIIVMDTYETFNKKDRFKIYVSGESIPVTYYCTISHFLSPKNINQNKVAVLKSISNFQDLYYNDKEIKSKEDLFKLYNDIVINKEVSQYKEIRLNDKEKILKKISETIALLTLIEDLPSWNWLVLRIIIGLFFLFVNILLSYFSIKVLIEDGVYRTKIDLIRLSNNSQKKLYLYNKSYS